MNKAFTKESATADEGDDSEVVPALPMGTKNYITPDGYAAMRRELLHLLDVERPQIVEIVSWAAKNGDRSENGDYLYGKKRLREIDRRLRFLTKRLDLAAVVDPCVHYGKEQVFFGATVTYCNSAGLRCTVTIKGIDEVRTEDGEISWIAPIARALLKARVGDEVVAHTPSGVEHLEILAVTYPGPTTST